MSFIDNKTDFVYTDIEETNLTPEENRADLLRRHANGEKITVINDSRGLTFDDLHLFRDLEELWLGRHSSFMVLWPNGSASNLPPVRIRRLGLVNNKFLQQCPSTVRSIIIKGDCIIQDLTNLHILESIVAKGHPRDLALPLNVTYLDVSAVDGKYPTLYNYRLCKYIKTLIATDNPTIDFLPTSVERVSLSELIPDRWRGRYFTLLPMPEFDPSADVDLRYHTQLTSLSLKRLKANCTLPLGLTTLRITEEIEPGCVLSHLKNLVELEIGGSMPVGLVFPMSLTKIILRNIRQDVDLTPYMNIREIHATDVSVVIPPIGIPVVYVDNGRVFSRIF